MQRPIQFGEGSNATAREKRGLDSTDAGESQQPESKKQKVPALASVIDEALKVELCSSLKRILPGVVREVVERTLEQVQVSELVECALAKFAMVGGRSSPKQIEAPDGRNLQLRFRSRLSSSFFTGGKVEGEQGAAIHVELINGSTGLVVTSGPGSSIKLDVVVLEGDFNNEDDDDWTREDFESHVVKEREGKRPLLIGALQVSLKEGMGSLGELTFTDNSSWTRSKKFRLGVKVASGFFEDVRVREAKTDAFTVKDQRGELYKKHYPPSLDDEVWRLEKISKDGPFHKKLIKAEIFKVKDFLQLVVKDSQRLRNILGRGMSNKMWDVLVKHAKTCVLTEGSTDYLVSFNHQVSLPARCLPASVPLEQTSVNSGEVVVGDMGFNTHFGNRHQIHSQHSNAQIQLENNSLGQQIQLMNSSHQTQITRNDNRIELALGPHESASRSRFQPIGPSGHPSSLGSFDVQFPGPYINSGADEFLSEDDMQQLPFSEDDMLNCSFSVCGAPVNVSNDACPYSSYIQSPLPNLYFEEYPKFSAAAVVGWLKLKAALRCGIIIREKAAERRAQLVELDG